MSKQDQKTAKKQYFVQGMHCSSCEVLIRQDVSNFPGVKKVDVSLPNSSVTITAESPASIPATNALDKKLKELGYSFHETRPKLKSLEKADIFKVAAVAIVFLGLFFALEKTGFFVKFSLSSQSSLLSYFVFGLAAGLSSCAALVGGLLLSLSKSWNEMYGNNSKKSFLPFLYFNFSRIATFTLLGGILGFVGSYITISVTASSILSILISLLMLVLGFQMVGIKWFQRFSFNFIKPNKYLDRTNGFQSKYLPIIVGALTFFVPCGFTLIAQSNTLTSGSFVKGALQLLAFSLGTLPVLALVSFSSIKLYSNQAFSKKFSLFSGIIIVFFALYTVNSQLNVLGFNSLSDINFDNSSSNEKQVVKEQNTDYQVMQMEASGFEYYPKQITIQSGLKTKWEIYNSGASGCAAAVYARGLYPNIIYLKPGLNSVEFTAPKAGTYKISCSMGMVYPVTVKVL